MVGGAQYIRRKARTLSSGLLPSSSKLSHCHHLIPGAALGGWGCFQDCNIQFEVSEEDLVLLIFLQLVLDFLALNPLTQSNGDPSKSLLTPL